MALEVHCFPGAIELARGREKNALAAFRAAERQAERLAAPHPLAGQLRGSLLRTLIRMGATGQAEQALAELGEQERETAECAPPWPRLRLASGDRGGRDPRPRARDRRPLSVITGSRLRPCCWR